MAALDALHEVCKSEKVRAAQESGKLTVLFDSGIRTGTDILKAIALGAQGVLRMFLLMITQSESIANNLQILNFYQYNSWSALHSRACPGRRSRGD